MKKQRKEKMLSGDVYKLIEPGPVVLVATMQDSRPNSMTMSWHMMMEFEPPLIGCVISDNNYSFTALKKTKECTINIPSVLLIDQVVGVGNTTGAKVDKFKKFALTPEPSALIDCPGIAECFARLECRVVDTKLVALYNMFILEVVAAYKTPSKRRQRMIHHKGNGLFVVDGKLIKCASDKK